MPGRKKYGYLLLLFLVLSGLAGTPTDNSLTKKERKFAADHMKNTRVDLVDAVKGLTSKQLNYKPSADSWSVQECVYHIAISEKNLWTLLEMTMNATANPEKRSEIKMTDEQIISMIQDRGMKVKTNEKFEPKNTPYKSMEEAMTDFKSNRVNHIKYIKATTEDLRNHVTQMPFGWLDCYQLCLMISAHTNRHTQQINEVKASAGFPN
jgi:hypothetical protein